MLQVVLASFAVQILSLEQSTVDGDVCSYTASHPKLLSDIQGTCTLSTLLTEIDALYGTWACTSLNLSLKPSPSPRKKGRGAREGSIF